MMPRSADTAAVYMPGASRGAWDALTDALDQVAPGCRGDARFTQDGPGQNETAAMRAVCLSCPILAECAAYAEAMPAHLMAGFWAGASRGRNTRADYWRREAS